MSVYQESQRRLQAEFERLKNERAGLNHTAVKIHCALMRALRIFVGALIAVAASHFASVTYDLLERPLAPLTFLKIVGCGLLCVSLMASTFTVAFGAYDVRTGNDARLMARARKNIAALDRSAREDSHRRRPLIIQ